MNVVAVAGGGWQPWGRMAKAAAEAARGVGESYFLWKQNSVGEEQGR